jgi:transcriptional regulator with XRE-family HTH domain
MIQEHENLRTLLRAKLEEAKGRNPNVSLRAYAKKVGISPGSLSLVLLGKRTISNELAEMIATNLKLDPQQRSEVIQKPELPKNSKRSFDSYMQLTSDQFDLISQWHYFAILNLMHVKNFKSDAKWIAKKLGISEIIAGESLELLERLNLICKDNNGNLKRIKPKFRTEDDIKNEALRISHFESLSLAKERLSDCEVENRDYTWVTFPMDKNKTGRAKELIRRFQDEFLELIEEKSDPTEVYRMAIQLFPLTKLEEN